MRRSVMSTNLKQGQALKQAGCDPSCGFLVRSHDEGEVVRLIVAHLKTAHNQVITEAHARSGLQDAPK